MNTTRQLVSRATITLLLLCTASAEAAIRHVAPDGSGADGQSWTTAYRSIQAAVNDPAVSDGDEIRVKQGIYTINAAIAVNKAVKILGGYSGQGGTRDPQAFPTVVNGGDSAWHGFVVTADAQIDGLTITGGNASEAEKNGGGMSISDCKAAVTNCVFLKNTCLRRGGGIALFAANGAVIADCTFTENKAGIQGGGIYAYQSDVTINGCTFTGNEADATADGWGGGVMIDQGSPQILSCTFEGNLAKRGAGLCNTDTEAYIESCSFTDCGTSTSSGGGIYTLGGSPTISRCLFHHNRVTHWGGAIMDDFSSGTIANCVMWANSAMVYGGAVYIGPDDEPPLTYPQLVNCTIYANAATRGGGLYSYGAAATLWNCIVWGNDAYTADPGISNNTQIWSDKTEALHCDIQGDGVYPGAGNLCVDPLFEDAGQGDFHLRSGSPCIDAGSSAPSIGSADYEGNQRTIDGEDNGTRLVDMGAFEFQQQGATNSAYRGEIMQTVAYDDVDDTSAAYIFELSIETDDAVSRVEFRSPNGGTTYQIPSASEVSSGGVTTSHLVQNGKHQWRYRAELGTPTALEGYGNGAYRITLYNHNASSRTVQVSYLLPGSSNPVPQPTQRPVILAPGAGRAMGSPVTLGWEPCTDPTGNAVITTLTNTVTGEVIVSETHAGHVVQSDPYSLAEGVYDFTCAFANIQEAAASDGTPFTCGKSIRVSRRFEVPYSRVYRFWSPVAGCHFYTISEMEKDQLINNYSHLWTFEGPVFNACTTPYHAGMLPVYRFWSGRAHFYTIDEQEREKLLKEYPDVWVSEGIGFYAYPEGAQPADCIPVYQFWNAPGGVHFYTASEAERANILEAFGDIYELEGIAFYVYP